LKEEKMKLVEKLKEEKEEAARIKKEKDVVDA
jgi:hypothetical protein